MLADDSLTFVDDGILGATNKLVRTSSGAIDCYEGETLKVTAVDSVEYETPMLSVSGKKPGDESGRSMIMMFMMDDAAEGAKVVAFFEATSGANENDSDGSESSGEIDGDADEGGNSFTFVDGMGDTKRLVLLPSREVQCYDGETLKVTAVVRIEALPGSGLSISGKKPGDTSGRPMSLMF